MRIRKWMWSRPDGPEEARKGARQQGACKTGRGGGNVRAPRSSPYKVLVSAFPWQFLTSSGRENCKGKRVGSLLLGEEGHKVLKSQTLVPGRILLSCP